MGVTITSSRDLEKKVKAQTLKASLISGYLRDIIWGNKYMLVIAKQEYKKTMTYVIETRAENATTKRLLQTTEMRTLRGITLYKKRRYQDAVRHFRCGEMGDHQKKRVKRSYR